MRVMTIRSTQRRPTRVHLFGAGGAALAAGLLVCGAACSDAGAATSGGAAPANPAPAAQTSSAASSAGTVAQKTDAEGYPEGWPEALRMPEDAKITSHFSLPSPDKVTLIVTAKIDDGSAADAYDTLMSEIKEAGYTVDHTDKTDANGLFSADVTSSKGGEQCLLSVSAIRTMVTLKVTIKRSR